MRRCVVSLAHVPPSVSAPEHMPVVGWPGPLPRGRGGDDGSPLDNLRPTPETNRDLPHDTDADGAVGGVDFADHGALNPDAAWTAARRHPYVGYVHHGTTAGVQHRRDNAMANELWLEIMGKNGRDVAERGASAIPASPPSRLRGHRSATYDEDDGTSDVPRRGQERYGFLKKRLRRDVHLRRDVAAMTTNFLRRKDTVEHAGRATYRVACGVFAAVADAEGARLCKDLMMERGVPVMPYHWADIIRATVKDPKQAEGFLAEMLDYGVTPNSAVYDALLWVTVRGGTPREGHITPPDTSARAFAVFKEMRESGIYPTADTYKTMFAAAKNMAEFRYIECIMRYNPPIRKMHAKSKVPQLSICTEGMRLARTTAEAEEFFNECRGEVAFQKSGSTRVAMRTALLRACIRLRDEKAFAATAFAAQREDGAACDAMFYQAVIDGCAVFAERGLFSQPPRLPGVHIQLAEATFEVACRGDARHTRELYRAMSEFYLRVGQRYDARRVLLTQSGEAGIAVSAQQRSKLKALENRTHLAATTRRRIERDVARVPQFDPVMHPASAREEPESFAEWETM